MGDIMEVFEIDTGENVICEDCGEEKYLQFGICISCGGKVVDKEDYKSMEQKSQERG